MVGLVLILNNCGYIDIQSGMSSAIFVTRQFPYPVTLSNHSVDTWIYGCK